MFRALEDSAMNNLDQVTAVMNEINVHASEIKC